MKLALLAAIAGPVSADDLDIGAPLKGSWYNPDMRGQGFFVEVFQQPQILFIGWFGFPRPSENASMDSTAHRWYTLEGKYSGNVAETKIYLTTAGVFVGDAPVNQEVIGTARIHFTDCNHGTIVYAFDSGEADSLAIRRNVLVPESDCESLVQPDPVPNEVASNQTTVFDHVTVLVMPGATLADDQMVRVQNGLITYSGKHDESFVPADAVRIDGRSRFLIPGLVDTHTHLGNHAPRQVRDGAVTNELTQYLANGVTTILVPGNGFLSTKYNDLVEQGVMHGPKIFDARWVFSPANGGRQMPANAAEARLIVQTAHDQGYQFIKFFDLVSPEVTFALLEESATLGMPAIAHFQETVPPPDVLDSGLDLVAHMQEFVFDYYPEQTDEWRIQQAIEDMLRNKTSVTTTMIIDELTADVAGNNQSGIDAYWARPEVRWLSQESIDLTQLRILTLKSAGEKPGDYDDELAFLRTLTRELHLAGVPLLLGTDAPGTGAVPGFSVHWEIQALLNSGLSLADALEISIWNGAQFIHQSLMLDTPFGAIRNNWQADLVLLESNPLASAENLKTVAGVMTDGSWRSGAVLEERLEGIAASYGN